jgi:NADPH-dependent 7-cyano-7-deazaguanine reductase QueF
VCQPRRMTIMGDFSARGGISTLVTVEFIKA